MVARLKVLKQSDASYNGKNGRVYQDRIILQDTDEQNPLDVQLQMELRDEMLHKYGEGRLKGKTISLGIDNFRVVGGSLSVSGVILEIEGQKKAS